MGYTTKTRKTSTYGAIMIMPHACQGDRRFLAGPAGMAGSARGRASVDMSLVADQLTRKRRPRFRQNGTAFRIAPVFPLSLAGDRLDARDHLVDRLVDGHLFADDAVHRLRPHVFVVDDRELVVF